MDNRVSLSEWIIPLFLGEWKSVAVEIASWLGLERFCSNEYIWDWLDFNCFSHWSYCAFSYSPYLSGEERHSRSHEAVVMIVVLCFNLFVVVTLLESSQLRDKPW